MKYNTLEQEATAYYEVKGSKFYAHALPVAHEKSAQHHLHHLRSHYAKASHLCYAYLVGIYQPLKQCSDAGEPANTAGKPILQHIEGRNLANVLVAVARYFGGIKLGKGGLVSAYGNAAKQALMASTVVQLAEQAALQIAVAYDQYPYLLNTLKQWAIFIQEEQFLSNSCRLMVTVPSDEVSYWKNQIAGMHPVKFLT